MLRKALTVTPSDHPDWVNVIEAPSFEDFFVRADELYQKGQLRVCIWQKAACDGQSAVPENSLHFRTSRLVGPKNTVSNRQRIHIDTSPRQKNNPNRFFGGNTIRLSEQFEGLGTELYYADPNTPMGKAVYDLLLPRFKPLGLNTSNPYQMAGIKGPVRPTAGQAAMIFKRSAGYGATLHGIPATENTGEHRKTYIQDVSPNYRDPLLSWACEDPPQQQVA